MDKFNAKALTDRINNKISLAKKGDGFSAKQISDGYHTFQELYDFRLAYNVLLFNEWAKNIYDDLEEESGFSVHKSWKHHDDEWCFGEEKKWFIVSAMLPAGLISNHYEAKDWDKFKVPEVDKALFEFDGHDGSDVLKRLNDLL
jgi:hypothetical protein